MKLSHSLLTALDADASTAVRTRLSPMRDSGSGSLELRLAGAQQLGGTPPSSCASLLLPDVDGRVVYNLALTQLQTTAGLSHLPSFSNAWSVSNVIINIDRCWNPAPTDDSALWCRLFIAGSPRLQNNFSAPVTWIRDPNLLAVTPRQIRPGSRLGRALSTRPAARLPSHIPTLLLAAPAGTRARAALASPASNSLRHCSGKSSYFNVIDGIVKTRLTNYSISKFYLYEIPNLYLYFQVKLVKFHADMLM